MILVLDLEKVSRAEYLARLSDGNVEVTDPLTFASLAEALRGAARAVPAGFARFLEPRYCGCTTGTISCDELAATSDQVAQQLVNLVAQLHLAEGR